MIIYAESAGERPTRIDDAPGAADLFRWLIKTGRRAVWVLADEGVQTTPTPPCCYGSKGE